MDRLVVFFGTVLSLLVIALRPAAAQAPCPNAVAQRVQYAVKIDSAPPGASIYIDSKTCPAIGQTPWTGKLNAGTLTVIVEAPGYAAETRTFTVKKVRTTQDLFVPLRPQPKIEVRADADKNLVGATVFVDGQANGQIGGPVVVYTTQARHLVEIKKDGFESFQSWVDLTATPQIVLTPALKEIKKYGTVIVESDVPDAEVYIDQNKHPDNTTATIENVPEGIHVIEVRKNGQTWSKTLKVEADKQVKIRAELTAGVGVIRVMSDTPGAHAFIDGIDKGPVPVDIKDIKAGDHVIQVKAAGFKTYEETVQVLPGSSRTVNKQLETDVPADTGTLKIIAMQPDAEVFVDGVAVGKAQELRKPAGEYLVVVRLSGYKNFEQKVRVEAGKTTPVTAELKRVGRLRILSTPAGATVSINGFTVGKTPLETEAETGETILRIEMIGYNAYEETLKVDGGDKVQMIARELAVAGKSDGELEVEQKGLSSYGARTLPRGRSTVDFDLGYPYFAGARINVGAGRLAKMFGFDASVAVRTMLARSELGLGARAMLSNAEPFSAGLFSNLWWGSKLFDDSFRNGVTFEAGAIASLTALSNVTISGRAYAQFWSDRHCPNLKAGALANSNIAPEDAFEGTDPIDTCKDYLRVLRGENVPEFDRARVERLTGQSGTAFFSRDGGARFLVSLVAEIAVEQHWNYFLMIEGAPFQGRDERALFTSLFSGTMAEQDYLFYARMGLSYKF